MKVVGVITISFPVILSLTRVEEIEGDILNRTLVVRFVLGFEFWL